VTSADFRQIAERRAPGRSERLFRAAISAFCSLVRPSRREIAALDDLAMPLYPDVSSASKRYAAAALSECSDAPPRLIRRLAGEPVELSAPLLIRSPALGDRDLVALIGKHGLPHARAIARRPDLHPAIASLLDALKDPEILRLRGRLALALVSDAGEPAAEMPAAQVAGRAALEEARRILRAMMLPAEATTAPLPPAPLPSALPGQADASSREVFDRLRDTALAGHLPLFQTALADALALPFEEAAQLAAQPGRDLFTALRALGLQGEQAFLVVSAAFPRAEADAEAIRLFLYRYDRIDPKEARTRFGLPRHRNASEPATTHQPSNDTAAAASIRQAS
jgi:uncharacterized protein (DUF2336 family)